MLAINRAFSLIELMVVITIIGILAGIAIPSYNSYSHRARLSELVTAAAPYKLGVTICYQTTGQLNDCDSGKHSIPHAIKRGASSGLVDQLKVYNGVITVTPKAQNGITKDSTFVLKPTIKDHQLNWHKSGGAIDKGLVS